MQGIILKGIGGFYYVAAENVIYECRARGIFRLNDLTPLAGDRVEIEATGNKTDSGLYDEARIEQILPRLNEFDRPPCANVDTVVLVCAAADPAPSFPVMDRFIVSALKKNCRVVMAVTKQDIADHKILKEISDRYGAVFSLFFVNGKNGDGVPELKKELSGSLAVLAGASGVGKSTLTNALLGGSVSTVGNISDKTQRGKNTTRHTEVFRGDGFSLLDTPGFTSFDAADMDEDELAIYYPEFEPYLGKCGFSDCTHISEPDCAVRQAVRVGQINKERYKLFKEIYLELKNKNSY